MMSAGKIIIGQGFTKLILNSFNDAVQEEVGRQLGSLLEIDEFEQLVESVESRKHLFEI